VRYTPRPYQAIIRSFALEHDRCNIFASPGMGKTGAGLDIFESRRLMGQARRMLVLAPKRVAQSAWPDEVVKWRGSFGHLRIAAAVGSQQNRIAALKSGADIIATNYENVPWLVETMGDAWDFDMVFADESPRLKGLRMSVQRRQRKDGSWGPEFLVGQGTARAKALAEVAFSKVRYWLNATGSPAPNGIQDLWGQQWFVDRGQRLGNSFDGFSKRWFRAVPGGDGYSQIEPLPYAQREVEALLAQTSITINAKDWFDLEDVIEREVYVDLPPKARRHYLEMEKQLFTELEDGVEVEAFNQGSKAQKCLQIASGALIVSTPGARREWQEIHDEKIEALRSIYYETSGEALLVAYQYKADLERILKAFPKARELDDRPQTQRDWNAGKIRMLVCHPASAGHGLSLQHGGRILVDFSTGYNLEHDEQVIERIGPTRQMQSGLDRSVFRYRIIARDTTEQHSVLPRIREKLTVQESLKRAMAVRKNA
jgi:SNF2 family DNA or RNA helicase